MDYGFLIRNDRCIGCHACTTACKSENDVPVGVNRTWVKNVETGRYPDVRRSFQVTRCNHCANPPCVRICPVTAMYQRADGIVEFDPDRCIGCKACLQACPYDAIYIDPDSGTAAKCHFCAHRIDLGLEPACVVVCPEHAIISGDLDDPASEISREVAAHRVTVRRPEQGTAPKLFYVDGEDAALHPTATERVPAGMAWTEVQPLHGGDRLASAGEAPAAGGPRPNGPGGGGDRRDAPSRSAPSGTPLRRPSPQGRPPDGPIAIGAGRMAGEMVRNVYNAPHRVPWHWPVPAYLVTKGIAAGIFMLLALGEIMGLFAFDAFGWLVAGFVALAFTAATTALLVFDLERPERFLRILTRPQWRSWLAIGGWLLVSFTVVAGGWWVVELGAVAGWWDAAVAGAVRRPAFVVGGPLAAGVAVYTAFLFGQAEGRDLWQNPQLPVHLLVQALLAGSAALLLLQALPVLEPGIVRVATAFFAVALVLDVVLVLMGEVGMPHASDSAARAAEIMTRGRYAGSFWVGSVILGHAAPLALLLLADSLPVLPLAATLALVGLYLYEHAFVMAAQEVPNS